FAAANLLVLIGQVLAALSFYGVCRWLRYRWEWSALGAVAFGLSPYAFARGLQHLTLTYYWHVPLGLLVAWWSASAAGLPIRSRRFLASVVVAVVTGLHNPYYANIFLQFLAGAAMLQAMRRAWRKTAAPIVLGGACVLALVAINADTLMYRAAHGANT